MAREDKSLHFSSACDEWGTPQWLFDELHRVFDFTLDPCATAENAKCPLYYTQEQDGLKHSWTGHRAFVNPPYGRDISNWIERATIHWLNHLTTSVLLIPARVDTRYWHDLIFPHIGKPGFAILFLRGRLKFGTAENSAPFPTALVMYGTDPFPDLSLSQDFCRI